MVAKQKSVKVLMHTSKIKAIILQHTQKLTFSAIAKCARMQNYCILSVSLTFYMLKSVLLIWWILNVCQCKCPARGKLW